MERVLAIVYGLLGLAFFVESGRAEAFSELRLVFTKLVALVFVPIAVGHLAFRLTRLGRFGMRRLMLLTAGTALLIGGIFFGVRLDVAREAETQLRGDAIVARIESYTEAQGRCPGDLAALGEPVPSPPALAGSRWRLRVVDGMCRLDFQSTGGKTCARFPGTDWACDD
ncbi:MAG: hypothetical protein AAGE18_01750 [Pseudomonadota bacterium]